MKSIAVIGAGWAGLAGALTLSRSNAKVTVFEAAPVAGGRARSVMHDGRIFDNGQHLLLGAYERTLALIQSLHLDEAAPMLCMPLTLTSAPNLLPTLRMQTRQWPEPWNLLFGLAAATGLSPAEKIATLVWAAKTLHGGTVSPGATVATLIADQPPVVRRLLWEPLCIAALNTPPAVASAKVFVEVLRRTFSGRRHASRMIIPSTDLTAMFPAPALSEISERGGVMQYSTAATAVLNAHASATVTSRNGTQTFDAVIVAVAPQHVPRLLSQDAGADALAKSLSSITYEPITTLYFDFRHVYPAPDDAGPMRMLSGEPGQWVFWARLPDGAWRAGVVISAHHRRQNEAQLTANTLKQLTLSYQLPPPLWRFVITEKRATYACSPEQTALLDALPKRVGRIYFAGDWCHPLLPATIEAAVISGETAAHAALTQIFH